MDANVFGRPAPASVATDVLANATLSANPSPRDPLEMPAGELPKLYARLLFALYEVRRKETHPLRLHDLQSSIDFAQRVYREVSEPDATTAGPPGPSPMPPQAQAQAAPPSAPPAGAAVPPSPGAPPAPTLGAVPA